MAQAFDPTRTIAKMLAEHGPLHQDDIARRLGDAGKADLNPMPDEMRYPAAQLVDDRWVWLPAVLAGRVYTHRVDADELAADALTVTPDLSPIAPLCGYEEYARFADGSPAQVAMYDYDDELLEQRGIAPETVEEGGVLLLTSGTLQALGVAAGDLVGLRQTDEGLALERVLAVGEHDVGARLAAALEGTEPPESFSTAVWTACVADPAAFTEPVAPLCEIADESGLAHEDGWLAPAGFDFDRWRFDRGCESLAERHDIDSGDALALYTLIQVYEGISLMIDAVAEEAAEETWDGAPAARPEDAEPADDGLLELAGALGAVLADPELAEVLVSETIDAGHGAPMALGVFAEVLEPRVERPARVACRWLRAVALERIGEIDEAERELLTAESMDPDWPLPLLDLARFASDRGDVERGLALLRRAGAEDDPLAELLMRYRAEPRRDLGRNDACWCGSGRKYKKCHLGREQLPLAERARWLYAKAVQHALASGWEELLVRLAHERSCYADDPRDALDDALEDPLVMDAALFEGGAFEDFLRVRGPLLPDDERLLAEQWLLVDRSVFEVLEVRRGQGVTVRDLRTGDIHEIQERTASRQLKAGQLICARVVPAGDTTQILGGVEPVSLAARDRLINLLDSEPDPVELVAELTRRFAPPGLANTEGDPLTICEAAVQVSDPDGIEVLLDGAYDRVGVDPPRWLEQVTLGGMERVRATLVLDVDTVRVETNSEQRMDRVLATLADLDPEMIVLDDSRLPVRDAREAAELAKQLPADGDTPSPDDPKMAAALEDFIRE